MASVNQEELLEQANKQVEREFKSSYMSFFIANGIIVYVVAMMFLVEQLILAFDFKMLPNWMFTSVTVLLMNSFSVFVWPLVDIFGLLYAPSYFSVYVIFFVIRIVFTLRYHNEFNIFAFKLIKKYFIF